MNTHKQELAAKARHLWFLLLLCMHLVWGGVPGPCRHSVTKDHLLSLNRLIDNQRDNGCSIIYAFAEHQSLSKVCYIKAAFPQILELLNTHFHYVRKSDNRRYVSILKKVIYNIYSQRCIPEINEEIEDSPVRFTKFYSSSPKDALKRAKGLIQMYMTLLTESRGQVNWSCQGEYAILEEESTTSIDTLTIGGPECECSCPTFAQATTQFYPIANRWSRPKRLDPNQIASAMSPSFTHPHLGKLHSDTTVSIDREGVTGTPSKKGAVLDKSPLEEKGLLDIPAIKYDTAHIAGAKTVALHSTILDESVNGARTSTCSPKGSSTDAS